MKYGLFLILLLATSLPGTFADEIELPDFGDSSGTLLSPEYDRRLGRAFLRHIRGSMPVIYDPEIESYINSLGFELVANSDNVSIPFTFFVINSETINAFAGPGGVIGMNSGVILNSKTESEVAGVMAHEIAHVTQRHLARSFEQAERMSLPMAAAMIGAIILATQNPEAGTAALAGVTGASVASQIGFTRANEIEADSIGMQLLARSRFDPKGMPDFFTRLQRSSRYYAGNAPEFLRTHPLTSNRIAESVARAEEYGDRSHEPELNYYLVRAKLRLYATENNKDSIRYFGDAMSEASGKEADAMRYGYALALTDDKQFKKARGHLKALLQKEPTNSYYLLAAAQLERAAENFDLSISIYEEVQKYYPDYRPIVFYHAKTLLDARRPDEARDLLRSYGLRQEPDITYYNLLSQAEGQMGNAVESAIVRAEYFYLLGDTELAIQRLNIARNMGKMDDYQKQRIDAKLSSYEYERSLEKELKL